MATPTKNFQDPTGLSRLAPMVYAATAPPVLPGMFWRVASDLPSPFSKALVATGMMPRVTPTPPVVQIPPPPMGRLILSTFSSVYKERGTGVNATGRIFPRRTR